MVAIVFVSVVGSLAILCALLGLFLWIEFGPSCEDQGQAD